MSFLKKLGSILIKAGQIAGWLGPVVAGTFPKAADEVARVTSHLRQIALIIVQAEAMGQVLGLPGADKLKAAAPMVGQIILQSDIMLGKDGKPRKIKDVALFQRAVTGIAGSMADLLNSLDDDVDVVDVT